MWSNSSCWTSNHPPSYSWQENICWCLPCPTHKNKRAKQSRTAPKGNSDSFFMSQNLKKCWIVLDPGKKIKKNLCLGRLTGQITPMGWLAFGMLLSIFVAPADFSPISMFYGLLNVFSLQKSVHFVTLALTPLFTHCAAFLSAYTPCHRSALRNCFQKLIWNCKKSHVSASQINLWNTVLDMLIYFTSTLEQLNSLSFVLNKILKILFWFEKQVSFLT